MDAKLVSEVHKSYRRQLKDRNQVNITHTVWSRIRLLVQAIAVTGVLYLLSWNLLFGGNR